MAWKIYAHRPNNSNNLQTLNQEMVQRRNVRKTLWKQANLQAIHRRFVAVSNEREETNGDEVIASTLAETAVDEDDEPKKEL